ncbi:hypothetical protein AVEN_152207-1 [Araneus ventricosus]|uniref:Uncharacterized protein n=1 Tax=Araneus ventricosus TaxID=182803 RepID=A0A4Y2HL02_ARAVE|nr:hypothetical protein AVEN_152207-1 [Araneus ventricosus]
MQLLQKRNLKPQTRKSCLLLLFHLKHRIHLPKSIPDLLKSVLKLFSTDTHKETVSFQFKVPESNKNPPDFSDFKTVTNRKKLKKDSSVNQDNITVDNVSQYCKPPQFANKEPSSNFVTKQSNITVTKNGTKSAHGCSVGLVPESKAAFPPEKAKVLQSLESDADAEMSSSSASEGDTLQYDTSEDLEDTPQNVCPTTPPPPSTHGRDSFFNFSHFFTQFMHKCFCFRLYYFAESNLFVFITEKVALNFLTLYSVRLLLSCL